MNKAKHKFYTKFMEENSKDQGDLFRVVMKLQKAENNIYGIVMQYLKSQQLYLVAIQANTYEHFDGEIQIPEQTG